MRWLPSLASRRHPLRRRANSTASSTSSSSAAAVAGLATALFSRWHGNKVLVLEKAPQLGGTTRKAAFWYWVPNNAPMRAAGTKDPKKDCLRYMARLSRPEMYDADAPTVRHARMGIFAVRGDLRQRLDRPRNCSARRARSNTATATVVPDYWAELPEDKAPKGRVLLPKGARETMSDGGEVAVRTMSAAAKRDGVDIRTGHRVQRVIKNADGEVIGVEADTREGQEALRRAQGGRLRTGGFTHDVELRKNFLSAPVYRRLRRADQRGRFRPHRQRRRRAVAQHELRLDVPDRRSRRRMARDPDLIGTFSPCRRLDDLRRTRTATASSTRSSPTTRWRRCSSNGTARGRVSEPRA